MFGRVWVFALLIVAVARGAHGADFSAEVKEDRVAILVDGKAVMDYVFKDLGVLRPFFAHVREPGGIQVTRSFPPVEGKDAVDHATMHPGIWLGFGSISGEDFWRNKGRIVHQQFLMRPSVKDEVLEFATESEMLRENGSKLAALVSRFRLKAIELAWILTWDAEIHPLADDFWFGDQEEMGLGIRVATGLTEKDGGSITSSTGLRGAKATWGQQAQWCDYSGSKNGRRVGAILVPSAKNPHPSWWHNRDYGVFVSNPFGRKAMKQGDESRIRVPRGKSYRLSHSVIIYGATETQAINLESLAKHALIP